MKSDTPIERLYNGIVKENPTFVLTLGMCPTLAVTTSAMNGLGMGLTTAAVLTLSNIFIAMLRKVIPDRVRIPSFIVIIASFVTIIELLLKAYIPSLYVSLGIYIPLIVVNCIILGRAEAYASKHNILASAFDGLGMGVGFSIALTLIGALRELLGAGTIFGFHIMPDSYIPCTIFIMAPGAFFVLAALTAIQNKIKAVGTASGKDMSKVQSGCMHDCLSCKDLDCREKVLFGVTDTSDDIRSFEMAQDLEILNLDEEIEDTVEIKKEDLDAINAVSDNAETINEKEDDR